MAETGDVVLPGSEGLDSCVPSTPADRQLPKRSFAARSSRVTGMTNRFNNSAPAPASSPSPRSQSGISPAHRNTSVRTASSTYPPALNKTLMRGRRVSGTSATIQEEGGQNCELRTERRQQMTCVTLSAMIGMDCDLVDERPVGPLRADQDADRIQTENATIQLLHQTCRSRIVRLNAAGVIAGSWESTAPSSDSARHRGARCIRAAEAYTRHLGCRAERGGKPEGRRAEGADARGGGAPRALRKADRAAPIGWPRLSAGYHLAFSGLTSLKDPLALPVADAAVGATVDFAAVDGGP